MDQFNSNSLDRQIPCHACENSLILSQGEISLSSLKVRVPLPELLVQTRPVWKLKHLKWLLPLDGNPVPQSGRREHNVSSPYGHLLIIESEGTGAADDIEELVCFQMNV